MKHSRIEIAGFVLGVLATLMPQPSQATVGLAEWSIYTPGGNIITHQDGFKDQYGNCLKADESDESLPYEERYNVYVSHLYRWQYYPGYVVGESRKGFFIFHEATKKVDFFPVEKLFLRVLQNRSLGKPKSAWLTGQDGWNEAWFPMIWKTCRAAQQNSEGNAKPDPSRADWIKQQCQKAISPETLALYRETTWGRQCQKLKANASSTEPPSKEMQELCEAVMNVK